MQQTQKKVPKTKKKAAVMPPAPLENITKRDPGIFQVDISVGNNIITVIETKAETKQQAGYYALSQIKLKIHKLK